MTEHVAVVNDAGIGPNGVRTYHASCPCGWAAPKPTVSKGAAGFSASAHVKKANGQPVFAPKAKAKPANDGVLRHLLAAPSNWETLCGLNSIDDTAEASLAIADDPKLVTCPTCVEVAYVLAEAERITRTASVTIPPDAKHRALRDDQVACGTTNDQRVTSLALNEEDVDCPACLAIPLPARGPMAYTLPATRVRIPTAEYAIVEYREFRGQYDGEGPAFNAYLIRTRNLKKVATVDYMGNGGEMDVRFLDVPKGEYEYADSSEKRQFVAWVERFEGKWSVEYDLSWCFAGVIATLVEEAQLQQVLDRKRHISFIVDGDDPLAGYRTISTSDMRRAAKQLSSDPKLAHPRVWVKGSGWVPATEMTS